MSSVKSFVTLKEKYDRIVVLIDMDCFYCQVEEYLDPERLSGKPIAVVQYLENAGIIAVNYAARALGVTRHMREKEAKAVCSELICVKVPSKNGKADLSKYRDAGYRVAKVLQTFTPLLERASIDEAYLDITENVANKMQEMRDSKFQLQPANFFNTFAVGYENIGSFVQDVTSSVDRNFDEVPEDDRKSVASSKLRLLIGAAIVSDIRRAVKEVTNYECSAGIAHNKILAKLTCGMNKPNKQTILPIESISELFQDLAVNKVKSLGGKLGEDVCSKLNVKTMADLLRFSESELQSNFQARVGSWLYWMARGIDLETVTPKFMSKSIAVSKNFRGKNEISSKLTLKFWLTELAKEIVERLEKDEADCKRLSKQLIVSFSQVAAQPGQKDTSSSRTVPLNGNSLNSYTAEQIADEAFETIKRNTAKFLKVEGSVIMNQNIKHLGISAGKFEEIGAPSTSKNLQDLLKNHQKKEVVKPQGKQQKAKPMANEPAKEPTGEASIDSIKKFEMKSPKVMTKSPTVEKVARTTEPTSTIAEVSCGSEDSKLTEGLKTSESFAGENSIEGIVTFKHWVKELLMKLNSKLKTFCDTNQRVPSSLILNYKQMVGKQKDLQSLNIPLHFFDGGLLDGDVIVEMLINCDGFLKNDGSRRIQYPIVHLDLVPNEFQTGDSWNFSVKDAPVVAQQEKHCLEVDSDVEDDQSHQSDQEFFNHELIECEKPQEEFTEEAQKIPIECEEESRDYGIDDEPEETVINDFLTKETQVQNINQSETSSTDMPGSSYLQTYAEFQPQNNVLELLNPKEACLVCGKMIGKLDMISHIDHHLAFQLATQQREEYRQKNKLNVQSSSSQSASKKSVKLKTKPKVNSIEKYAVRKDETLDQPDENKIKCDLCQRHVATDDYVSHLDYHYAQKLREEDMKRNAPPKVDLKRKRPGSAQKNLPKMKSMKSYFSTN